MRVKVISHSRGEYMRERRQDLPKLLHNPDPILHPFEKSRELVRALNAVKLERLFAQPFVKSLEGHVEGVYAVAKNYKSLTSLVSGSADGELRLWDLGGEKSKWNKRNAHSMFVRGVAFLNDEQRTIFILF